MKDWGQSFGFPIAGILVMATICLASAIPWDLISKTFRGNGAGGEIASMIRVEVRGPWDVEGIYEVPQVTSLASFLRELKLRGDVCPDLGLGSLEMILGDLKSITMEKRAWCWELRLGEISPGKAFLLGRAMDINEAEIWDLTLLPGVGPATARKIVKDRELKGPFHSVQDLARVNGISPKLFSAIEPFVAVPSLRRALTEEQVSGVRAGGF